MDIHRCSHLTQTHQGILNQIKNTQGRLIEIKTTSYRYVIPLEDFKILGNPRRFMAGSLIRIKNENRYGMAIGSEEYKNSMQDVRFFLAQKIKSLPAGSAESSKLRQLLTKVNDLLKFAEEKHLCGLLTER